MPSVEIRSNIYIEYRSGARERRARRANLPLRRRGGSRIQPETSESQQRKT